MATVLGARGWECGNSMLNAVDRNGAGTIVSTWASTGTYSLQLYSIGTGWARWAMTGTPASPSVSVWILPTSIFNDAWDVNGTIKIQFELDTGEIIEARFDQPNHTFDAYVDGAKVADGTVELLNPAPFHLQFSVTVADVGSIEVKLNGHECINYIGDTKPGAATGAIYLYAATINQRGYRIDDLVWGSGGYLGDLRCPDIRPTADTAQDDWTPSAGDNYSTIDETPPSDADYNETNTDAQADELDMGDFDGVTYDPRATVAWVRAKMLAATGDSIKVGVDSAATDSVTEHALSTDEEYYFHTNDDNPADSGAWEDADIDALKLRYESVIA